MTFTASSMLTIGAFQYITLGPLRPVPDAILGHLTSGRTLWNIPPVSV